MFQFHGRLDDSSLENQREYFEQLAQYEAMQEEIMQENAMKEETIKN